jgi:hypothetical protein
VRARNAYCKVKSKNMLSGKPIEKTLETRAADSLGGNITASAQVPFFYASPNVARVNLAMTMATDALKFEKQKGKFVAPIDVLGIAYRPDGSVAARFSDAVKLEYANKKDADALKGKSLRYDNEFEIAPGQYSLKIAFTTGGESFGKVEMPLAVEPYSAGDFRVSSLALSKEIVPTSGMVMGLGAGLAGDRTPLVAEGVQVIPAGSNRFKKTDPAAYYFEVYEPLLAAPETRATLAVGIQVRVLDRKGGTQISDSGVMRLNLPEEEARPVIPVANRLPLASLSPGSYVLELRALDSADNIFIRTVDFEVE